MSNRIPKFIRGNLTSREWRTLKRKQLRELRRAYSEFNSGSFYAPGYGQNTYEIGTLLRELAEKLSVKNWK